MEAKRQNKILRLFEKDPQAAMSLMVEEYSRLVWKAAQQYLDNPEDIKECVNDTFMEFYMHRDRFDPAKGTLATFLCAIARKRAVSLYRKNKSREAQPLEETGQPAGTDESADMDMKIDLEKAMAMLKPEDLEIIRMKYYVGMTIQEIADSLDLPYETVKKRHQRSLGKLRLALIAALVLLLAMLLMACAYIVVRYLGFVPGYGITEMPDIPVYITEEAYTVEHDTGEFVLREALLVDGEFIAHGVSYFDTEKEEDRSAFTSTVGILRYGDETYICLMGASKTGSREMEYELHTNGVKLPEDGAATWEASLEFAGMEFPLVLQKAGVQGYEGFDYWLGDNGGLLILPKLRNGNLEMDIYVLNVGKYDISDVDLEGFTAEAPDGQILKGRCKVPYENFVTWEFGEAEPGKYQLHIPEVKLRLPYEGDLSIPLNLEECRWDDQAYEIPGGTVRVIKCVPLEVAVGQEIPFAGEIVREGFSYWELDILYQMDESEDPALGPVDRIYMNGVCPTLEQGAIGAMGSAGVAGSGSGGYYFVQRLVYIQDGIYDIAQYSLQPDTYTTRTWKCDAVISFTVKAEDQGR